MDWTRVTADPYRDAFLRERARVLLGVRSAAQALPVPPFAVGIEHAKYGFGDSYADRLPPVDYSYGLTPRHTAQAAKRQNDGEREF